MYNLTKSQKEALCWIVQEIRDGNLAEEFSCVFLTNGKFARFQGKGADIVEEPPITEGALNALMASELIVVDKREKFLLHCTLRDNAYKAVDSNFEEVSDIREISFPRIFYLVVMALSIGMVLIVFLLTHNLAITGFILFAALLIFLFIGTFQLRQEKSLSEKNFMQLMELFIKQLPLLLGKGVNENKDK